MKDNHENKELQAFEAEQEEIKAAEPNAEEVQNAEEAFEDIFNEYFEEESEEEIEEEAEEEASEEIEEEAEEEEVDREAYRRFLLEQERRAEQLRAARLFAEQLDECRSQQIADIRKTMGEKKSAKRVMDGVNRVLVMCAAVIVMVVCVCSMTDFSFKGWVNSLQPYQSNEARAPRQLRVAVGEQIDFTVCAGEEDIRALSARGCTNIGIVYYDYEVIEIDESYEADHIARVGLPSDEGERSNAQKYVVVGVAPGRIILRFRLVYDQCSAEDYFGKHPLSIGNEMPWCEVEIIVYPAAVSAYAC